MCAAKKFYCQICRKFSRRCYLGVLQHIRVVHSFEPDFHILCGLDNDCPATYTVYESFRSHVYKKHRELLVSDSFDDNCYQAGGVAAQDLDSSDDTGCDMITDYSDEDNDEVAVDGTRIAAMFILRTTEIQRTSQVG